MLTNDDIYDQISDETHVKNKNAIMGSHKISNDKHIVFENDYSRVVLTELQVIDSMLKCFDEVMVNVCDHAMDCSNKRTSQQLTINNCQQKYLTDFNVTFDSRNGEFTIYNTGYGIPNIKMQKFDNKYLVEALFSMMRTGKHTTVDKYSITGGTNGMGVKGVMFLSKYAEIENNDGNLLYKQRFDKNKKGELNINEPIIEKANKKDICYTKIMFRINYEDSQFKKYSIDIYKSLHRWIFLRFYQCSLFLNIIKLQKAPSVKCIYSMINENGETNNIQINPDINNFMNKFNVLHHIPLAMKYIGTDIGYNNPELLNLKLIIGVQKKGFTLLQTGKVNKFIEMSIINGVHVKDNELMKYLVDIICAHCENQIRSKIPDPSMVTKQNIKKFLVICCFGTVMDADFIGQVKDKMKFNKDLLKNYEISERGLNSLIEPLTESIFADTISSLQSKKKNGKILSDKYTPATHLNKRGNKEKSMLFILEGDSAEKLIKIGINKKLSYEYCGTLTSRGVIMNTYNRVKHINTVDSDINSQVLYIQDKVINENVFFQSFIIIMNLDVNKTYEDPKDLASLTYRYVILATDQDLDGFNIKGLFLTFIIRCWPNLIKHGVIRSFETPQIRIKPKKASKTIKIDKYWSFERESDYLEHIKHNRIPNGYDVKFYKGLGSHEDEFNEHMFENFDQKTLTFLLDDNAFKNIEIFYGKTKETRTLHRQELCKPIRDFTDEELLLYKNRKIKISTFLEIYVREFQFDNIKRKLLKLMDGQNNVGGKLLGSYRKIFNKEDQEYKVANIGAKAAEISAYHHGEMSIYEAILHSGQYFVGKKYFPPLIARGQWGTRTVGGKDHAQVRYITGMFNKKLFDALFPTDDLPLLEHEIIENQIAEPKYFVPILPLTVLENYKTVAHAWKIEIYARDHNKVINIVKKMINGTEIKNRNIPPSKHLYNGIFKYSSKLYQEDIEYDKFLDNEIAKLEKEIDNTESKINKNAKQPKNNKKKVNNNSNLNQTNIIDIEITEDDYEAYKNKSDKLFTYSLGTYEIVDKNTIRVTELPIGVWTSVYKTYLTSYTNEKTKIKDIAKLANVGKKTKRKSTTKQNKNNIDNSNKLDDQSDYEYTQHSMIKNDIEVVQNTKTTTKTKNNEPVKRKQLIVDCFDYGELPDGRLNILITMENGWENQLPQKNDPKFTDLELYLNLRVCLHDFINLIDISNQNVVECKDYMEVIERWFPVREQYYKMRIIRNMELLKLKIMREENIINYITNCEKYRLTEKGLSNNAVNKILSDNKFDRLNINYINNPPREFINDGELTFMTRLIEQTYEILDNPSGANSEYKKYINIIKQTYPNMDLNKMLNYLKINNIKEFANYKYLESLTFSQLRSESTQPRYEKIKKYKEQLEYLSRPNIYKEIWLNEINNLVEIIKKGFKNDWLI